MPVQFNPFLKYDTGYPDKHLVLDGSAFQRMLNFLECSPGICFDFETSGLEWFAHASACGIALAGWDDRGIQNYYVPFRHQTGEAQLDLSIIGRAISDLLGNSKPKIAHNLKFDEHMARREGWRVKGKRYDTMIAAKLFDENRRVGLKTRAIQDLGCLDADRWEKTLGQEVFRLSRENRIKVKEYKRRYGYSQINIPMAGTYACFDVEYTTKLFQLYEGLKLSSIYPRIWDNEMLLTEVICDMEEAGLLIDVDYLESLRGSLEGVRKSLELQIAQLLGNYKMNIGSDAELRKFLIEGLRLRLTKPTAKTKFKEEKDKIYAVDKEVLESFQHVHPAIGLIMQWREVEKLLNTYTSSILKRLDSKNILHPDFQQNTTTSGRMACKEPNFQNQPSDNDARAKKFSGKSLENGGTDPWSIRRAFINRGKGWVRQYWDFSQIELRILAYYSKDPVMTDAYIKGEDIHERTSMEVFGTKDKAKRRLSKALNFGISYGLSDVGFARDAKIPLADAEQHMAKFFQRYAGIPAFRNKFWAYVRKNDCQFQNLFGRPRRVTNLKSYNIKEVGRAERQAIATLIQGTAAELTKESLVRIWQFFKENNLPAHIVSTVHDEIQIDCHTDVLASVAKKVKELMEDFPEFDPIPIVVDGEWSTKSWADKQKLPM